MGLLKNKFVILAIVIIIGLLAWYFIATRWKDYKDWGAMRYVDKTGNRPAQDPLFNSVGLWVADKPKAEPGQTVEIKSADGVVNGRFMILDILQEMRLWKANVGGWWIATDASWAPGGAFSFGGTSGPGTYRII